MGASLSQITSEEGLFWENYDDILHPSLPETTSSAEKFDSTVDDALPPPPTVINTSHEAQINVTDEDLTSHEAQINATDEDHHHHNPAPAAQQELEQNPASSTPATHQFSPSQSQNASQVIPVNSEVESQTISVTLADGGYSRPYRDKFFFLLFVLHLLAVATGIGYLILKLIQQKGPSKFHSLKRWCPKLGADLAIGIIFGCVWQFCFKKKPRQMVKIVLWSNAFLTFAAAVMLIATGLSVEVGVGVVCLLFSIAQSLYSCWVSRRLKYAGDILSTALTPTNQLSCNYHVSYGMMLVACVWLVIWIFGVVGAINYEYSAFIIMGLLLNLAWTMEVLRNIVHSTVANVVARVYLKERSPTHNSARSSLRRACSTSFGSICLGSMFVPLLHTLRVMARGLSRLEGQNELCFSCADCFIGVMETFIRYAHNWGYVQVIHYGKPFVRASKDTWDVFISCRMDVLINADLTSSLCVLSGISGGMVCVLGSGAWAFATHKAITSSISLIAFFIGYFLVRIAMAVPQGSVAAHYVCYAQDPTNQQFLHSPVLERLKELWPEV